jgi:beta-lactamase regulating signal transducer with metallopeptidase domain/predicted  nucleic acid-binding Zn-ribbon protein
METALALVLASLKAFVLLAFATAATLALRQRPARVRAVIWATAIAGCLVIPAVTPLLPAWSLPVPAALARFTTPAEQTVVVDLSLDETVIRTSTRVERPLAVTVAESKSRLPRIDWKLVIGALWALGAAVLLARLGVGIWRVRQAIRATRPVVDSDWQWHLDRACDRTGCRRAVRLLWSPAIEVPATVGVLRPTILLPARAATWLDDRRRAVLQHEVIHVARFDWPVRMIARVARAIYWFNPLIWWAVRRLDLEQELACDEEVLALGTGASDYACHLLGIARHAVPVPAPAIPALGMARRTHLEERIMTILKRSTHRRVGTAVLIATAALMAAMVPALAAVYPADPPPRQAGPELKAILAEMEAVEARMEPELERIEEIQIEMEPQIELLEDIEIDIDEARLEDIEKQMRPYLERLEAIEIDMEPFNEQMEALESELQNLELHIEDGTLEEIERQIHEQMEAHMALIESVHVNMEPFMEQMEAIHREMEPLHAQMEDIHIQMEPIHLKMEDIHIAMEPFQEQLEEIHRQMEPFHEEMERLGDRLEAALRVEVIAVLEDKLGSVIAPGAPLDEAAARIVDEADINVHDQSVRIHASRSETREILGDLLTPHRIGVEASFTAAIESAADAFSSLVIETD